MTAVFRPAAHVRNPAKYYDRTVQEWHARTFPKSFSAIDVDLMGFCPSCSAPLYFIEAAEVEHKPTSVLRRLGRMTKVPSLLIIHGGNVIRRVKRVDAGTCQWHTESETIEYIYRLRQEHVCQS